MTLQLIVFSVLLSSPQNDTVRAGDKLYQRYCSSCHGAKTTRDASPDELLKILRDGRLRKGMPSWSHLPPEQRRQIVTYLKSATEAGR